MTPQQTEHSRRAWLLCARRRLANAGVEAPSIVAQCLLGHRLGLTREQLIAHDDEPLGTEERANADAMIERRLRGTPLAYLTESIEFWGLPLRVTPDVLVPRGETEHLVEAVLETCRPGGGRGGAPWVLVDVGTGSGCIPIAVASEDAAVEAVAIDLSAAALAIARENVARHGLVDRIALVLGDGIGPLLRGDPRLRVDVIVSNPPYIDPAVREILQPEVRCQPEIALFAGRAGEGGLTMLDRLMAESPGLLVDGGWLVVEVGYDQAARVRENAERAGCWSEVRVWPDLAGIDRVVGMRYRHDGASPR